MKILTQERNEMSNMKIFLFTLVSLIILVGCQNTASVTQVKVSNSTELNEAISSATPGTEIVMTDGNWEDVQIRFYGNGTKSQPITLRAETSGKVLLQGSSDLKLGGEYLIVDGLQFVNGASPSRAVIQFSINEDTLANDCRVTNCVIKDFNKSQRNKQDLWVLFKGRRNQLDQCYLAGKSNRGPTIRVDLAGNESINNYHQINNNYFGPRPPKGGPSAETIQIGNSFTSMAPSYTQVYNNFFDRCNGEVEVISSKTNFNEFRNNVFYKSEGSLVTRHGNYCIVDGNYFIGDEDSPHVGGVRLIGTGHRITNNYFYKLRGEVFRGPLAIMNGIPKSPLNRYIQVTDVVVAHNTWVDCTSPWQLGVGSNIDQKEVLPPSEIRSETPIRTLVANNIIYNSQGDEMPILRYDSIDGIDFQSNVINNQGVAFRGVEGLLSKDFTMEQVEANILIPFTDLGDINLHDGFEFEKINKDLFGNSRKQNNIIGATNGSSSEGPNLMDMSRYGPGSYAPTFNSDKDLVTHAVSNSVELIQVLERARDGDVIDLATGLYELSTPLEITKKLTLQSVDSTEKAMISYMGDAGTPAFQMNPGGELILKSVLLKGNGKNYAFASLKEHMSSLYNLKVQDAEISNFDYVLKAYKYSFSEFIEFNSSVIKNCNNGLELSAEDDDRGDYNAENIFIVDSQFDGIQKNVIDYYRGGYDESTVGGNLIVRGCTFTNSGAADSSGILINTYGIINVDLSENEFRNNRVKLVARLWGAKNNSHTDNIIRNSGRLIVEQNLPLKLLY